MTDHQDRSDAERGRSPAVRLAPPPKVVPGTKRDQEETPHRAVYWITAVAFVILIASAIAVFVLLPRWVPEPGMAEAAGGAEPADEVARSTVDDESVPQESARTPIPSERVASPELPPPTITPQKKAASPQAESRPTLPAATPPTPASAPVEPAAPAATRDPDRAAFARAIAAGLGALDRGELAAARTSFESALTLAPEAAEARDGLARVASAEQLATIAQHRQRAIELEAAEDWADARAEYAAVLVLDPTIRFARTGAEHSEARHELSQQMTAHIDRPDRLSEDTVLEEARRTLEHAAAVGSPGPVLAAQIDALDRQIEIASTPIPVVLLSDDLTEILVYRVGRLGTFERKELQLRPGTYTVVGTRAGFRDVRRRVSVEPGATPSLTVRCEEKI